MFGLEGQDSKKPKDFIFELEKELKDQKKYQEILKKIEGKVKVLKEVLRSGETKEDFDKFATILQGYGAILKVMTRIQHKK